MTAKTLAELKAKFETGDTPTAQDFIDLLDSFFAVSEENWPATLPASSAANLTDIPIPDPLPAVSGELLKNINPSEYFVPTTQPSYSDATHIVVSGDQRNTYLDTRRLQIKHANGYWYTEIVSTAYDGVSDTTTITLLDAMADNTMSEVGYGIFRPVASGGAVTTTLMGLPIKVIGGVPYLQVT